MNNVSRILVAALVGQGCSEARETPPSELGSSVAAIRGGAPATMYPEGVYVQGGVQGGGGIACSGVVLAPFVVLTAGHCAAPATTYVVTAPYAGPQVAHGLDSWSPFTGDPAKAPDVLAIFLDAPIRLAAYPIVSATPVAAGTPVVDLGRTLDASINNDVYVSPPVQILGPATSLGFPYNYEACPDISEDGDSGGPIELASMGPDATAPSPPHTVVAIVDTDTIEQGIAETSPIDMFARLDVVAMEIAAQIAAHGGFDPDAGPVAPPSPSAGGCGVARSSPGGASLLIIVAVAALLGPRIAKRRSPSQMYVACTAV